MVDAWNERGACCFWALRGAGAPGAACPRWRVETIHPQPELRPGAEDGEDVHGATVSTLRRQVQGRDGIRGHCW